MQAVKKAGLTRRERMNIVKGLLFISPWAIGFIAFVLFPLVYSLVISLFRYSGMQAPVWLGLQNYQRMFTDPLVGTSTFNTFFYTILAVPIGLVVALLLAIAMNRPVREAPLYRTLLYLPSLVPAFTIAFIFIVLVNPQFGIVSQFLGLFGVPATNYLGDPTSAKWVIIMLAQLGAGNAALIFLAGMNGIPTTLYDAARIDGASKLQCFFRITLPLLSPTILFNLITAISGGLQVFTPAYIMTNGGPNNGTLFYMFYLYRNAFSYAQLGYASALAVALFLVGMVLSVVLYTVAQRFVNYEVGA
uniref:Sugar ABC transporter permease n=1 Tax=Thermosporothrix sp. COM3 TaxID=2490863 RepID=A0A455SGE4_9CHLR|nr:sugar ABC transporter permease [Thermosporothrix sp. COM3]